MFNPPVIKPKGYAYGGLVNQPSLRPATIQTELDALTNDLRKTNKPKKTKETPSNEKEEFKDAEEFKEWVKLNTESDEETDEVFFIQPKTGEKIAIGNSPETNVLLYEVFKEQTGREGDALDAIADKDIRS